MVFQGFQPILQEVKKILDTTKKPVYIEQTEHEYADKFSIVQGAGVSACCSFAVVLAHFGLSTNDLEKLIKKTKKSTITIRFEKSHQCSFVKEVVKKKSGDEWVVENSAGAILTSKTVQRITEYLWEVSIGFVLKVYAGSDPNGDFIVLKDSQGKNRVFTKTKDSPLSASGSNTPLEVDITPLLKLLEISSEEATVQSTFEINRDHKDCHTPRRNKDIIDLSTFSNNFMYWADNVSMEMSVIQDFAFFGTNHLKHGPQTTYNLVQSIFVPVIPFFIESETENGLECTKQDGKKLMDEFIRSLSETVQKMQEVISQATKNAQTDFEQTLLTAQEVEFLLVVSFVQKLNKQFQSVIDHVENVLENQIVSAIGQRVSSKDLNEYMEFHYRKIFLEEYAPRPFSYDIRVPGHAPEGSISIESGTSSAPIRTMCRIRRQGEDVLPTMKFALSASTDVKLEGNHQIHGYIGHQFTGEAASSISVCARARQFSSFVLLAGTLVAKDRFEPTCSIIIQNKDELVLPLLLNPIPTAKEFKKSISSLSPEQQEFANAYRSMQMGSSLFALAVVPIKPLLERLLKLPSGVLTKEIELTQNLMRIFIEYQIPSDLVTFDGEETDSVADKIENVRKHVEAVLNIVDAKKKKQLEEKIQREKYMFRGGCSSESDYDEEEEEMLMEEQEMCEDLAVDMSCLRMNGFMDDGLANDELLDDISLQKEMETVETKKLEVESEDNELPDTETNENHLSNELKDGDDYTAIAKQVEDRFVQFDEDAKLRPTKVSLGDNWVRRYHESLLSDQTTESLSLDSNAKQYNNQGLDLIDALSRSGELSLTGTTLHVLVAVTHCFDKTVMETIIQDNVNPILPIERSSAVLASFIHHSPIKTILSKVEQKRILESSPKLLTLD